MSMTGTDYVIMAFFALLILFGIFEAIKSLIVDCIRAWKGPSYNTEYIHDLANIYIKLKEIEKKIDKSSEK